MWEERFFRVVIRSIARTFRLSSSHARYFTGVQGRFLVPLEMTIRGGILVSLFLLAELFHDSWVAPWRRGAPKAEDRLPRRGSLLRSRMKVNVRWALSRIVIPNGAYVFFVVCGMLSIAHTRLHETPTFQVMWSTVFPARRLPYIVRLTTNKKDFSHSLDITIREKVAFSLRKFFWFL